MGCSTGNDHCCHLGVSGVCPFLIERAAGRRWACGLRVELGSWDAVHTDPRYVASVQPYMTSTFGVGCGDWPPPGDLCGTCGKVG